MDSEEAKERDDAINAAHISLTNWNGDWWT